MNPETIQRVAQNLPNHMLHSLSQVASQTPHYPHTPGGGGYGANMHTYPNTVSALGLHFTDSKSILCRFYYSLTSTKTFYSNANVIYCNNIC